MNSLERRLDTLEAIAGAKGRRTAILPVGFTGTVPPGVIGIYTGVPRHGDDPSRYRSMERLK